MFLLTERDDGLVRCGDVDLGLLYELLGRSLVPGRLGEEDGERVPFLLKGADLPL